jgi:hypothetical protein
MGGSVICALLTFHIRQEAWKHHSNCMNRTISTTAFPWSAASEVGL